MWTGYVALVIALGGCAPLFLGLGDLLSDIGSGFHTVGQCLSPLEPIRLDEVLAKGRPILWTGDTSIIDDAEPPEVVAFLSEQLDPLVLPVHYLLLRFYRLGSLSAGETLEIEVISDALRYAALYDSAYTLIPGADTTDESGRRTVCFPIHESSPEFHLRISLFSTDEPPKTLGRLRRISHQARTEPRGQIVVLNFAGADDVVTFRSGVVAPTDVGPFDPGPVSDTAVRVFREIYAPYNLTVLTHRDPPPDVPHSVIHVGPATPSLPEGALGYAEYVDGRNTLRDDAAIVDLNHVALRSAALLGPEFHGRAIGAVAAHEMGHLLGLAHVADAEALMTGARCQGARLELDSLLNRRFKAAPVLEFSADLSRWTLGIQDPRAVLLQLIGPNADP